MAAQPGQWKRRILLPIWAIRILAMLFMCLAFGISIKLAKDSGSQLVIGIVVLFFLLIVAVLLMDVMQVIMLLRGKLTPLSLLITSTLQTTFWAVLVIMDIVYIVRDPDVNSNASGLVLALGLMFLFASTLIYAVVMYVRQRKEAKRGAYAPAHNPLSMPNMTPTPYTGPAVQHHNTAYHSPMHGGDLGQQNIPLPAYSAPPNYYAEPPAKPANMV